MNARDARPTPRAGLLALALLAVPAVAQGQGMGARPQGTDVTVSGVVVDVSCKFGQGLTGDQHRMCAQVCADRGIPLASWRTRHPLCPTTPQCPATARTLGSRSSPSSA
jgi:hypothetical protein